MIQQQIINDYWKKFKNSSFIISFAPPELFSLFDYEDLFQSVWTQFGVRARRAQQWYTFFWQKHFFQSFCQINSKNSKSQITGITHLHLKCSGRLKSSQHELFVVLVDCDLASCGSFGLSILHGPMAHDVITIRKLNTHKDSDHLQNTWKVLSLSILKLGQNFAGQLWDFLDCQNRLLD